MTNSLTLSDREKSELLKEVLYEHVQGLGLLSSSY